MRGNIISSRALILSALWIGCWSVLVSAQCNSTQHNGTVTCTASFNTTITTANVSTSTFNNTTGRVDSTNISAITESLITTVTPTARFNNTVNIVTVNSATVNATTGNVNNTTISATTAIQNTTGGSTASVNTNNTTVSNVISNTNGSTATVNATNRNVNNTTLNHNTESNSTPVMQNASFKNTIAIVSVSTAIRNTITGNVDNTTISAATASLNTNVTPSATVNTTIASASLSTYIVSTTNGIVYNTSVSATSASQNTTVGPTASPNTTNNIASISTATTEILSMSVTPTAKFNTTAIFASGSTATVNATTGNNTTINATNASNHTPVTPTTSFNNTIATVSVSTANFNNTIGNVENTTVGATTRSLNTNVTPTAKFNTTATFASGSTATVNAKTSNVNNTTINATTASNNNPITPTTSINNTIAIGSGSTATVNATTGNVNNTTIHATTASNNTPVSATVSFNNTITIGSVSTANFNKTTGNVDNSNISATTAILSTSVTPTAKFNTTATFASGSTATVNARTGNVNNTTLNATTASNNTPTASFNNTIASVSASTANFNKTVGNVENTTVGATTPSINTNITPTAGVNTLIASANVSTYIVSTTNGIVYNTSVSAISASQNTTVGPTASLNTTNNIASISTAPINITIGNVINTIISATTARINTNETFTTSLNIPTTTASVSTATFENTTGNVKTNNISATTTRQNTTVRPNSSVNTTITIASVSTVNFNNTTGNVENSNMSATTEILSTSVTLPAKLNITASFDSGSTATVNATTGNVNNTTINATNASDHTPVAPTASFNNTIATASVSTANFNNTIGNVENTTVGATTPSINTNITPTAGVNTSIASARVSTYIVSTTNGIVYNTNVSATSANQKTTVGPTASPNTTNNIASISTAPINITKRNASLYSSEVKGAFLQAALVRSGLSSAALPDSEVLQWVNVRLRPLLSSLSSADVTPYFNIIRGRSCNTRQTAVSSLDSVRSSFNSDTQTQIYSNIQQLLTGLNGLGCYNGGSFYAFIKSSFLSFGFPDLSAFLSLIPASRQQELLGSISPGELNVFLNGPNTVRNGSDLCTLLNNYNSTNQYLETQPIVSAAVGRQTLGCVWSRALSVSSQDEVDQWFNVRLAQYLPLLSSQLISPTQLSGASCLSYRKLVSILGNNYNISATDFTPADVYSSIKAYLNSSDGSPRCYNSSNPLLNSTAWFANNIGFFITFISLTDLQSFVSDSQIGVFLNNSENIQLFNNSGISSSVTTYYGAQLYIQNPNLSPLSLPGVLLCGAPGSAFVSLNATDSQTILDSIKKSCQQISPEVTAALVANFPTLSADTIQSLGNQSIGLSEGQISDATPSIINNTLPVLSVVIGWNQGQVNNIIQSIINAGFSINSGPSLVTLGTLVGGVPSATISKIPSTELLTVSKNPTFISNILIAPVILQETYVQKLVSLDQTKVVENVPDALAGYIPPVLLSSPTSVNVTLINKKSWRQEQAVVLFSSVASASDNTEELSESILQGFTCSSVQNLPWSKVTQLVKACRPRASRNKVVLKESQLTCMYNYVKDDSTLTFTDLPADMLLYYSLGTITSVNCESYFRALGGADFSVLSSVLNRQSALFTNAKDCLGITGVRTQQDSGGGLNRTQVEILGNMACTLDSTYIQNSDPLILEKLKNCGDLSDSQVAAIQTLLLSGNTSYGNPSTWNQQTLDQLGILPLYLNQSFWVKFSPTTTKTFLKTFFPYLRKQKIQNVKLRRLFTAANSFTSKSINTKARAFIRAACTTGNITEATIKDTSFPFGYDSTQFDACLDNGFLKDNIAAITEKVIETSFLTVVLNKLYQLFPSGLPDSVVQILNAVSRVATVSDINKWNITTIDTLSSLMNLINGDWTSDQSKAVIMRYLSVAGNTLGTAEINAIGSYVCSLDPSVLKTITAQSLRTANRMILSSCSIDQQSALYSIAKSSFSAQRSDPTAYYQLISSYLGGAPLEDIIALSTLNISMDITTFLSLNPDVIKALNVSTVISLMGLNKADLKLFENTATVRMWVAQQYNSDLAVLGLSGGKADPVSSTAAPATNVTTLLTNPTITQTNQTVNATTGSAVVHRGSGLWLVSLCVGLLTITLHTL